jgi:acetylornithine deacetylase/succinyl-diaminopimelate desuccinylase-like protein
MDPAWQSELFEFLRIPSISASTDHSADVRTAGEWVSNLVESGGGSAELVDDYGRCPLVVGEIPASVNTECPTVMIYGHFDVQPPGALDEWESPPFDPEIRGEWIYGRGVADDKGQLYVLLKAATLLAQERQLPVTVRVICDGEEEVVGDSVVRFLRDDTRRADACVVFDGTMLAPDLPVFTVGTRGLVYLHLTLRTATGDLHSGHFGGAALNALHALVRLLSPLIDPAVWPTEGVLPPTREETDSWSMLQPGAEILRAGGAIAADDRAAPEFYERTFALPSLDINGVRCGDADLQNTAIPSLAHANLSMRLAPGQNPEHVAAALEADLAGRVPEGATLECTRLAAIPAGRVDHESPAVHCALGAFERTLGVRPLLVRSGGTLPLVSALEERAIPLVLTGFDVPGGNVHAANERLLVSHLGLGLSAARETLIGLADL